MSMRDVSRACAMGDGVGCPTLCLPMPPFAALGGKEIWRGQGGRGWGSRRGGGAKGREIRSVVDAAVAALTCASALCADSVPFLVASALCAEGGPVLVCCVTGALAGGVPATLFLGALKAGQKDDAGNRAPSAASRS